MKTRCEWADLKYPEYVKYHDTEWGMPLHNDRKLFEILILEGAQAGLSWLTIMRKRENYRKTYDNFDFKKIAKYNSKKIKQLMNNQGIVRNKLKINTSVQNAKVFIQIRKEFGSFDNYIWSYVNNKPIINSWEKMQDLPPKTKLSEKISKDLKARGMNFVGPTIIYSFMQSIGLVNDHTTDCFRFSQV